LAGRPGDEMIDFDEELKKFYPSTEIDEVQAGVDSAKSDAVDLYVKMGWDVMEGLKQVQGGLQTRDMRPGRRF